MKTATLDIGSNSVRLMLSSGGLTLFKKIITTRLGEGLSVNKRLKPERIELTANAVKTLIDFAKESGAKKTYVFATAAVRASVNGSDFTKRVKELTGIDVDVLSGEKEAKLGVMGALKGNDGGALDIGGASSEICIVKLNKIIYSKSLDIGTVRLLDKCGQDKQMLESCILKKIKEYGDVPFSDMYAIGGTATTLAAIDLNLEIYDPKKIDGHRISIENIKKISDRLLSVTPEERKKINGVQPERAEVIGGGSLLMYKIMQYLNLEYITVSESDNLEGYLMTKLEV